MKKGKARILNYLGQAMDACNEELYRIIYANDGFDYIVLAQNKAKRWFIYNPDVDPIARQQLLVETYYDEEEGGEEELENSNIDIVPPKPIMQRRKKEVIQPIAMEPVPVKRKFVRKIVVS